MASRRRTNNPLSSLEAGCYFCIGTLQQIQWLLCKDLGLRCEVFLYPTDLSSLISRADDMYGDATQEARIIVISEDQQAAAADMLTHFSFDKTYWTFIILDSIGSADSKYKMSVQKALDVKTKTAVKLSKSASKVIDLREIPFGTYFELFDSAPEAVRENYKGFPFTADFMLKEQLTEEEIISSWSWANEESQIVELYKSLFRIDGVRKWSESPYANALIMKSMYDRYDSSEENSNAPVIVKTTSYYIRPFLNQIWNGAPHQEVFEMYATWVYTSTNLCNNALCPGLRERVSRGGRRYLMFSPSATSIKHWLDITEHL